ncbi:MAG TPA: dTDP-4-dehydrorhamnose 3,5-epimerase family protein [Caulobacterales bacterium]|nr:dTDP-4-dehydrorhamnose 3,5-epimerase family protein [Caulobacterales bacterium]
MTGVRVKKPIEGVIVTPLKVLPNERGRLMEVQRRDDPGFPGFGQVYVTQSFANVVKAWYRHRTQVDQLAAITGLVKLVLYDDRPESGTRGACDEILMGELAPKLVLIPPGVWHGFKAVGDAGAFLLHLNTEPFDHTAPDEDRLPADDPSIPYSW